MPDDRTHELLMFTRDGALLMHLWFRGEHSMQMDLDVALQRPDVGRVDLIDCVNHTTKTVKR